MVKPKIIHISRSSFSVYLKIKVQKDIMQILEDFIMDLGVHWHGLIEKDYIYKADEEYVHCGSDEFIVHMIYGKSVHLLIITNQMDKLNEKITKHFDFTKPKKK